MAKPGFLRVLAVIVYDFLLLLAVLFLATAILLPVNGGEAFTNHTVLYTLYLLTVSFGFYGWFWTHGGQTLGLRAWKTRVLNDEHGVISWQQAFIRFAIALLSWTCLGLGFLWIIFDKNQRSWHDVASKTGLFFDDVSKQ
jgi:uncharacterized RDD family membrane protein YckC